MLRNRTLGLGTYLALGAAVACGSANEQGFVPDAGGGPSSFRDGGADQDGTLPGNDPNPNPPGNIAGDGGGGLDAGFSDGGVVVTDTIYANTDDSLYSVDPKTKTVTRVGGFVFLDGRDASSDPVTDVAVNAAGGVYVNTESAVYSAALPATPPGDVQLTLVAGIPVTPGQRFYALAFAPAGALGPTEMLVGGDGNGDLWSIDVAKGGTITKLGSFGTDPSVPGNILTLSGDIVFYNAGDGGVTPTGLATIRSCTPVSGKAPKCVKTNDYLAGVDMTALAAAFATGTPAKSLNAGIYGGSATSTGNGIGFGEVFGLAAWEGSVYGFTRHMTAGTGAVSPTLISIDATTSANGGAGTAQPGSWPFLNGWSGAGVTTKVIVTVGPPPPPPPPPK